MSHLKKLLDNTPKQVYNIFKKDEERFDLSDIPQGWEVGFGFRPAGHLPHLSLTLEHAYKLVRNTYEENPDLFPTPPVFAGGFFRDIVWSNSFPSDLDLFFNSHGMTKEEAEDNLCLFMIKMGVPFKERDASLSSEAYRRMNIAAKETGNGAFRVFDFDPITPASRCGIQAILKDMGPPQEDPLYVVEDFHYNHSRAALPVVGEPEIHYHGHAVFGWEQSCHVQFREGGFRKCREKLYGGVKYMFKQLDLVANTTSTTKPKSNVKMPNPCSEIILQNNQTYQAYAAQAIELQRVVNQNRNEFVNQFDPLRNNRRPVP